MSKAEDSKKPVSGASGFFPTPDGRTIEIRDVWASNLEEEMANIREILEDYPYIAMVRAYFSQLQFECSYYRLRSEIAYAKMCRDWTSDDLHFPIIISVVLLFSILTFTYFSVSQHRTK